MEPISIKETSVMRDQPNHYVDLTWSHAVVSVRVDCWIFTHMGLHSGRRKAKSKDRVRISRSQFAICELIFATCKSKVLFLRIQIFQRHVFIRLQEFRVCNVFFFNKCQNSYEIFKYLVRNLRAAILLLSQTMTSLLFASHVPANAQTNFPARGCLR